MLEQPGKPKQFDGLEPQGRSTLESANRLRDLYNQCQTLTEYAQGPVEIRDTKGKIQYRVERENDATGRPTVLLSFIESSRGIFEINEAGGIRRYDPAEDHAFSINKSPLTLGEIKEALERMSDVSVSEIKPPPSAPQGRDSFPPNEAGV